MAKLGQHLEPALLEVAGLILQNHRALRKWTSPLANSPNSWYV